MLPNHTVHLGLALTWLHGGQGEAFCDHLPSRHVVVSIDTCLHHTLMGCHIAMFSVSLSTRCATVFSASSGWMLRHQGFSFLTIATLPPHILAHTISHLGPWPHAAYAQGPWTAILAC